MINWHWIYRDFMLFYDNYKFQDDWCESYENKYLKPNREVLEGLHFKIKGFSTREDILRRIKELGFDFFYDLHKNIKNIDDFESTIRSTSDYILEAIGQKDIEADVYVIIGGNCTNIYSTEYAGKTVTVICLESIRDDIEKIKLLLSHEIHHWVRSSKVKEGLFGICNGERAVTEGLAINYSEFLYPGYKTSEYCYVPDNTVKWVTENWRELDKLFLDQVKNNDLTSGFFTRNKTISLINDMPSRTGYVYGYLKVKKYINDEGGFPIEYIDVPWEKVFQE